MATARYRETGILRLYRGCLSLYPAEFRDEYARELCLTFADRWREERSPRVWLEGLSGILQEAPKEHLHVKMCIRDRNTRGGRTPPAIPGCEKCRAIE